MPDRLKLSRPDRHFADLLESKGRPLVSRRILFLLLQRMHRDVAIHQLRLPKTGATAAELKQRCARLKAATILRNDRDYKNRYRVLTIPDLAADDIVCLADRFCYISHLSAMQRWNLTNRIPQPLVISRPDRRTVDARIREIVTEEGAEAYRLRNVDHPAVVRGRPVRLIETRRPGASIRIQGSFARVSTIGQTFLDMLQMPALCGGMSHVLDVWDEHARFYIDEIIEAVDRDSSGIVKCRAGYIFEEYLAVRDRRIEPWRDFAQRGGSRKLDPKLPFADRYSENWMLSLNVP